MSKQARASGLDSTMSGLKITTSSQKSNASKDKPAKIAPVADSWEEEDEDEDADEDEDDFDPNSKEPLHKRTGSHNPNAPPPTPAALSPALPTTDWSTSNSRFAGMDSAFDSPMMGSDSSRGPSESKRPEKSTAVASRLIAAGIGAKAPRRTEEQRQYDKAMREQERRKKEREIVERKREQEAEERAKRAMWDD